jgi:hypothetical protein
MFIVKFFYSILFILGWMWIIKYRKTVKSWTWNFYWAEHYIWSGWTYFIIMVCGLLMIFYWVIYPMWWLEFILGN